MFAYEIDHAREGNLRTYAEDARAALMAAELHIADAGDIRPYTPGVYRQALVLRLRRCADVIGIDDRQVGATLSTGNGPSLKCVSRAPDAGEYANIIIRLDDGRVLSVAVRNHGAVPAL